MSPCANGTNRSFFSAKSSLVAQTKVTAYRWPVSPACRKQSSIARRKFLPIWNVLAAVRQNQSAEKKNRPNRCRNRKSRSWTCYEVDLRGPARVAIARALTHGSGFVISCAPNYGRQNREGIERITEGALA